MVGDHQTGFQKYKWGWEVLKIEVAKSPEISVFTRLREDFPMLSFSDTTDFCFLKIEDELQELKDNVVQMLITTLANKSFAFRGDYTKLMRLCLILQTGEVPEGFQFVISRVGALFKTRWMSKAIAAIKLVLLKAKIFSELPPNRIMTQAQAVLIERFVKLVILPWVK